MQKMAYHIGDTLIFLREYPVDNVAVDGRIQSENPKILEAMKKISARSLDFVSALVNAPRTARIFLMASLWAY